MLGTICKGDDLELYTYILSPLHTYVVQEAEGMSGLQEASRIDESVISVRQFHRKYDDQFADGDTKQKKRNSTGEAR